MTVALTMMIVALTMMITALTKMRVALIDLATIPARYRSPRRAFVFAL